MPLDSTISGTCIDGMVASGAVGLSSTPAATVKSDNIMSNRDAVVDPMIRVLNPVQPSPDSRIGVLRPIIGMSPRSIEESTMRRCRHPGTALGAVLTLVLAGCAGARTSKQVPLAAGDRVQLTAPSVLSGELKGDVREISQDDLFLGIRSGEELAIPLEALGSLAIQRGTRRRVKEGALIGLGTGAVTFPAILTSEGGCGSSDANCQTGMGLAVGVLAGGGALLGTLVGPLLETEVWEEQTLPLAVEAGPNGLRVEVCLPFGRSE